ncbi:hypothetical protein P4S72_10050 [Vibrio sp. PP-XX7]
MMTARLTILPNGAVNDLAELYDSRFRLLGLGWDESLLLLMLGTLIGCIAAKLSALRHLKEIGTSLSYTCHRKVAKIYGLGVLDF